MPTAPSLVESTKSANCRQLSGLRTCAYSCAISPRRALDGHVRRAGDGLRLAPAATVGPGTLCCLAGRSMSRAARARRASCCSSLSTTASGRSSLPAGDGDRRGSSQCSRMLSGPGVWTGFAGAGSAPVRANGSFVTSAWQPPAVVIGRASRHEATVGRSAHGIAARCRSQPRANAEVALSAGPHQAPTRSRRRRMAVSGRSRRSWSALPVFTRPRRGPIRELLLPGGRWWRGAQWLRRRLHERPHQIVLTDAALAGRGAQPFRLVLGDPARSRCPGREPADVAVAEDATSAVRSLLGPDARRSSTPSVHPDRARTPRHAAGDAPQVAVRRRSDRGPRRRRSPLRPARSSACGRADATP